jgi:hypothetical protein
MLVYGQVRDQSLTRPPFRPEMHSRTARHGGNHGSEPFADVGWLRLLHLRESSATMARMLIAPAMNANLSPHGPQSPPNVNGCHDWRVLSGVARCGSMGLISKNRPQSRQGLPLAI